MGTRAPHNPPTAVSSSCLAGPIYYQLACARKCRRPRFPSWRRGIGTPTWPQALATYTPGQTAGCWLTSRRGGELKPCSPQAELGLMKGRASAYQSHKPCTSSSLVDEVQVHASSPRPLESFHALIQAFQALCRPIFVPPPAPRPEYNTNLVQLLE
jgi:hypothetical protein